MPHPVAVAGVNTILYIYYILACGKRESIQVVGGRDQCAPGVTAEPQSSDGYTTTDRRARRRGMEGKIAEDTISLHEGSLVKEERRVRNGNPCTPAQSVCAKYQSMRA